MRILIVSRWLAPRNIIGAVRPTQISKYLAADNEVTCISESLGDTEASDRGLLPVRVRRVPPGPVGAYSIAHYDRAVEIRRASGALPSKQTKKNPFVKSIRRFAAQAMHLVDELEWSRNAVKTIEDNIEEINPEVLISSYGPESSVLVGLAIKKKHPELVWVSDMRDPMTASHQSRWINMINGRWERKMSELSDAITTVSDALGDKYRERYGKQNVGVFVNGYAPDDPREDSAKSDGVLRIGYTGALCPGRRIMDALFKAIKMLEELYTGHVPVEVHYAGGDADEFYKQVEDFGVSDYIVNHGLLSRDEAQRLQEECDILCVLTWNTNEERGVLTGKFPEYLRLRKNILALVSGDLPDAELTCRIRNMRAGFSFEYCTGDDGILQMAAWIQKMIKEKQQAGKCSLTADPSVLDSFSYPAIAREYNDFIKRICSV